MANEDMDGNFLGGGAIEHVIQGGEIYLNSNQLSTLLLVTGSTLGLAALSTNDQDAAVSAQTVLMLSSKVDELRAELLRREAAKSLAVNDSGEPESVLAADQWNEIVKHLNDISYNIEDED